jgi:Ala-tRNA(Pro) deacylase
MTAYRRLLKFLDESAKPYRLIEHAAEGQTARASELRGHPLPQAAKCLVIEVRNGSADRKYILAVIPGNQRVNLKKLKRIFGGTDARLVAPAAAEIITGCVAGSIVPFSFDEELILVADPGILVHDEVFFNAARLDRSVALDTVSFIALANPRVESIAKQ